MSSFVPFTILTAEDLNAAFADKADLVSGKIPLSQIPDSVIGALDYKGTWDASTNTPAIPAAALANKGHYYVVNVAGTTSVDGESDWNLGDWIISNGTAWGKVDNSDKVSSVNGKAGVVVLVPADIGAEPALTPATQAEMEAGTETALRSMSPSRVKQAAVKAVKRPRSTRTSNTMLVAADLGKLIDITSGAFAQTVDAAATLGDGWYCYLRNSGYQRCTIDPAGTDKINGRLTDRLDPGVTVLLTCDGTGFQSIMIGRRQMRATRNFSILSTAMEAGAASSNTIVALDEGRVAYIGCQAASPYNLIACHATVNGPDDVTVQETVSSVAAVTNSGAYIKAVKIGTDKLLVVWPTANTINAVVVTFSGGVATFGAKVTQVSSGLATAANMLLVDINADAAIVYSPATSPVLYKVSVTGTVPAFSASLASTASIMNAFKLDTNKAFFSNAANTAYVIDGSGAAPVQTATANSIGRAAYAQTPLSPTSVIGFGTTNISPRTDVTAYVDSYSGSVISNTASKSFLAAEFSDVAQAVLFDPVYGRALVFYRQNSLVDYSQFRMSWVDIGADGKMNPDREFFQLRDVAVGANFSIQGTVRVIPLRTGRCAMLCKEDSGFPSLLILDY